MKTLLNLIWLVLAGFWLAVGYAVAGIICCVLIVTIPFGIAAGRMALFCVWPFGRTLVRRPDAGAGSFIGNVLWVVLAGWWLALGHLVTGVLMCLTVIGIPLGREVVDIDQARRLGVDVQVAMPADPRSPQGNQ